MNIDPKCHHKQRTVSLLTEGRLDGLLEDLDWNKIKTVIKALKWDYDYGDSVHRPTIEDLKACARRNLQDAAAKDGCNTSFSGGFLALKYPDGSMGIYFVNEWSETDEAV